MAKQVFLNAITSLPQVWWVGASVDRAPASLPEDEWTRTRFARDLALAPNDLIPRAITRLACP